ncbi:MAG: hypothetical protein EBS34_11115, partial [Flavobacteriales bacterium]|nr:hypothetical protein [Flavobacteriales bacterium]
MMLLSCTVQERYHRRGLTIEWNTISVKKQAQKTTHQDAVYQDLAKNNDEFQPTTKEIHIVESPQETETIKPNFAEPTDSIEKVQKRRRFNRNLIFASLGAIGIGGLMDYLNFTNVQVDPNYSSTNDYRNYRIASQISYTAGGIGLFSWLIKRGVEDSRDNQDAIIENNIVYDTTKVQENVVIQQNQNTNNQSSENLKLASSQANASVLLAVLGILTTALFGLGLILCIAAIIQANSSIKLAPSAPSARTALTGKRIALGWLKFLGILLGIIVTLILIA